MHFFYAYENNTFSGSTFHFWAFFPGICVVDKCVSLQGPRKHFINSYYYHSWLQRNDQNYLHSPSKSRLNVTFESEPCIYIYINKAKTSYRGKYIEKQS